MDSRIEMAVKLAREYKFQGYHCSEATIRAVPKALGIEISEDVIKASCAFFGGGGSTGGRCGVIESCLVIISMLYGRLDSEQSDYEVKVLAAELMKRYKAKFGSLNCCDIKPNEVKKFGEDFGCQRVYEEGAKLASQLLIDAPRILSETDPVRFAMKQNEESLTKLFSSLEGFSDHLLRYVDNNLPDMYDLNYFEYDEIPTDDEIASAIEYQKKRGDKFIKLESRKPLPKETVDKFGFEAWADYCMLLTKGSSSYWTKNTNIVVKNLKNDDIADDIIAFENENYGPVYGLDFNDRKMKHWLDKAQAGEKINFYAAYLDGKIVGNMYIYKTKDYASIDGLTVSPEYRNQYIATTLLAKAIEDAGVSVFLHADSEDTPKDMYAKLGFEVVDTKYNANIRW